MKEKKETFCFFLLAKRRSSSSRILSVFVVLLFIEKKNKTTKNERSFLERTSKIRDERFEFARKGNFGFSAVFEVVSDFLDESVDQTR